MGTSLDATPLDWVKTLPAEEAAKPHGWPPQSPHYFDWENWCTHQVYSDPKRTDFATQQSKPDFSRARSQLDYSYHLPPAQNRQELQDAILRRVVNSVSSSSTLEDDSSSSTCQPPGKPWIVFTAGAMGVGKGYVLSSLYNSNLFPLDNFLKIDPDMLKTELPEMSGYLQVDPATAATKVHRESTQMADILLEHALLDRSNILVDGSLRDVDYYRQLFQRIRQDYDYRIAILLVTAKPDIIHKRARDRAEKTGRAVPEELINESIQQVPQSVKELTPFANVVFEIANDDGKPLRIVSSSLPGNNVTWDDFADTWSTSETKKRDCALRQRCCKQLGTCMSSCWSNAEAHECARKIWGKAYPNMCPRCTLAEDGQCGVCIHGKHLCACQECAASCPVRKCLVEKASALLGRSDKS